MTSANPSPARPVAGIDRRTFLRRGAIAAGISWFGLPSWELLARDLPGGARRLVFVQFSGGNDGLNTVIPVADPAYRAARPTLAIGPAAAVALSRSLALHPAFAVLRSRLQEGRLAVVTGVGYPDPNRSHFRSMEIWQTASGSDRTAPDGWIGRFLAESVRGDNPIAAVAIGGRLPVMFQGPRPLASVMTAPDTFGWVGERGPGAAVLTDRFRAVHRASDARNPVEAALLHRAASALAASRAVASIHAAGGKGTRAVKYPGTRLARDLATVARLVRGQAPTVVYHVARSGFDTHAGQKDAHDRLLVETADALAAFLDDLQQSGELDRTLVVGFSEFGRRVAENGSRGTDHGTAGPVLLAGPRLHSPVLGRQPSVTRLDDNGDLRFTTDYRAVYAAVLGEWLRYRSAPAVTGLPPGDLRLLA